MQVKQPQDGIVIGLSSTHPLQTSLPFFFFFFFFIFFPNHPKHGWNGLNDLNVLNFLLNLTAFPEGQKFLGLHRKQHAEQDIFIALRQRAKVLDRFVPVGGIGHFPGPQRIVGLFVFHDFLDQVGAHRPRAAGHTSL